MTYRPGTANRGSVPEMMKPKGMRSVREIMLVCGTMAVAGHVCAGGGVWLPDSSFGPQITVYVSQPLWSRGPSARIYGMRLEQLRSDVGVPRRAEYGVVRRKSLIDLQIRPNAGTRLEFAARVSWDLGSESFGLTPDGSSRVIDLAFRTHEVAAEHSFRPWSGPHNPAALPRRFVLPCEVASIGPAAPYVRHRSDEPTDACDALAMITSRSALAF